MSEPQSPPEETPIFAVVPAAGIGKRMHSDRPKQYLELCGSTVLEHTLSHLLQVLRLRKIVVVLAEHDRYWQDLHSLSDSRIDIIMGGAERSISVLNGLLHLQSRCKANDWVLVHDAARPCLAASDIDAMITRLQAQPVGGLLAIPLSDTVKRVDSSGLVVQTEDRSQLWRAQTPQMFRYGKLVAAMENGIAEGRNITDEASAIELSGEQPVIVPGLRSNIKITNPEDIALAEFFLQQVPA